MGVPHKIDVKVVAEIGCNHGGDFAVAKEMIEAAAKCGAHVVKFQKRNPKECLSFERYREPYTSEHSFGKTYGEHREKLELSLDHHAALQTHAKACGVEYASSVWDITSYHEIAELEPPYIKVPSAHNEDQKLIAHIAAHWTRPVHISNGMCSREAEARFENTLGFRCVPYACTSKYPARMEDVCLLDIPRLLGTSAEVGFSGHHQGIALDVAAVALGATWVERHFTLDRTWKGTDQAASLEPAGLAKLCRDIKAVASAWKVRPGVLHCEEETMAKLKRARA